MIGPELRCRGLPCGVLRLMSRIDLCKAIWVKAAIWKILLIFVFFFFSFGSGPPGSLTLCKEHLCRTARK